MTRVGRRLARKEICDLDDTTLVEELRLKDVGGREVALLGGEVYGRSDREVTALVLVEDASEDRGGVEIGNAIGLD